MMKAHRIVFMGTPDFAVPALRALSAQFEVVAVFSQPDRPVGRGMQVQATPVKRFAESRGIPVFSPEKVSVPEEIQRIRSLDPDFIVVVAYGQILKPAVIEIPKVAILNIHSSLLPRWRGAAPIQWAILGGDVETGVTTMKIVPRLDAGDILLQQKTPIRPEDTAVALHDRLSEMGAALIVETIEGFLDGSIRPQPQEESQVTYAHKLTKTMENLDWSREASEIDRAVRALQPWPGTRVQTLQGQNIKIKRGRPSPMTLEGTEAGALIEKMGGLYLTCPHSSYEVLELQEEGKKSMSAADFLNGAKGRGLQFPILLKTKGELQ